LRSLHRTDSLDHVRKGVVPICPTELANPDPAPHQRLRHCGPPPASAGRSPRGWPTGCTGRGCSGSGALSAPRPSRAEAPRTRGRARFFQADIEDPAASSGWPPRPGEIDVLDQQRPGDRSGRRPRPEGLRLTTRCSPATSAAPFFLVAAFAPAMAAKGSGRVINIGSMAAQRRPATGAAYGATSAGGPDKGAGRRSLRGRGPL